MSHRCAFARETEARVRNSDAHAGWHHELRWQFRKILGEERRIPRSGCLRERELVLVARVGPRGLWYITS